MALSASIATSFSPLPQVDPIGAVNAAQFYRLEATAFHHAVVALVAKLVVIDGAPNKDEYEVFHALFVAHSPLGAGQARSLFMQRVKDKSSALQYARQIAAMTPGQGATHEDLIQRLFDVALADGALNAAELELLRAVADVLGISKDMFRGLMAMHLVQPEASPYEMLGVSPKATDKEVRDRYMAKVQKLHPDRYQAAGASAETLSMLSAQMAGLNAAYQAVRKLRAKKSTAAVAGASSWFGFRNTKGASGANH